ncbi:MAG: Bug family tripartite tricarboxylate transporter substrate binding protein [Rhodospirillales bacterium]
MRLWRILTLLSVCAIAFAAPPAMAEFPDKPIKIVVPYGAGGATHTLARLFAEQFEKAIGQNVVVTAVDGSGGAIGAAQVARARPDGYTLLMGSNGTNGMRWQVSETGYTLDDLVPLASVASLPTGFAVSTKSPVKSMAELTAQLKAKPNTKYASVGAGSSLHIAAERWAEGAGVKITHIAARGGKDAIVKLLSGEVEFVVVAASNFPAQKKDGEEGQIRGLAVSSAGPYGYSPELPTLKSIGFNFTDVTWWGPFVPKGTPKPVFDKLAAAVKKSAQSPAFLDVLKRFYYDATYMGPEEAKADLETYSKETGEVLKRIGMHKDLPGKS